MPDRSHPPQPTVRPSVEGATIGLSAADALLDDLLALAEHGGGERYVHLGHHASGGMGEVDRVEDRRIGRVVARKAIRPEIAGPSGIARFLREAQITARLEHPGIVPVHDLGETPDGRPCFMMKFVSGRSLHELLSDPAEPMPVSRLVDVVIRVCEAASFAHSRGIVHRDIKPANVVVGEHGEVLLLDWGIAREVDAAEPEGVAGGDATVAGVIVGTPGFMAPEQAEGRPGIGPPTDVFALGLLLDPRPGRPVGRAPSTLPPRLPAELAAVVRRATAERPEDRYPHAGALADALRAWRDGDLRRARAREALAEAVDGLLAVAEVSARLAASRARADELAADLHPWDPEKRKAPLWAAQDEAAQAEHEHDLAMARIVQSLNAAVQGAPELDQAHELLADLYRAQAEDAERRRDRREQLRCEALVREHDRGRHQRWLAGEGALSVAVDRPAVASLWRLEGRRRLEPALFADDVALPIAGMAVPAGSWLVRVAAAGCAPVVVPAWVERGGVWPRPAPDGRSDVIRLPGVDALGPEDCFVPAGWFQAGGDPGASDALVASWWWADAFVIRAHPVRNREYIAFLDALVAAGREADALRWAPTDSSGGQRHACYDRTPDGGFAPGKDLEGRQWSLDHPVVHVDWDSAAAYAAWYAERAGLPWRLPHDLEWEKAARGVDGRLHPWGDHFEPTWSNNAESRATPPGLRAPGDPAEDVSPYGVRDLAGQVRDWCVNAYVRTPAGPCVEVAAPGAADALRMVRGGAWSASASACHVAGRFASRPDRRFGSLGFRLARSVT